MLSRVAKSASVVHEVKRPVEPDANTLLDLLCGLLFALGSEQVECTELIIRPV